MSGSSFLFVLNLRRCMKSRAALTERRAAHDKEVMQLSRLSQGSRSRGYEYWIKKGDLIALDGKYINFDRFLDHATELDETYRIEQIGFDQWGSQTIINRLEDRWEVIPLGQGTKTMTQVINDFENLLVDERIIIAENECFRFMAKNCIAVYDEMLGVKYSKKKSKFKIDGIIAMLMGLLLCIEENGIEHYNPVEYLDAM